MHTNSVSPLTPEYRLKSSTRQPSNELIFTMAFIPELIARLFK